MKKELQKRLGKYTAAAAALVGAAGANAQVVYTNVDPDLSVDAAPGTPTLEGLDLNNDANPDFALFSEDTIATNGSRYRYTIVAPYGTAASSNAVAGETVTFSSSTFNYALALNSGDMINAALTWVAATNTMAFNVDSANPYSENWNGVTDKYLGLKFVVAGNTHYGWARLDVDAIGDVWTLKDYAYQSTPDSTILAGEGAATNNISEAAMEQLVHFVNQPNNSVKLMINEALTEGVVSLVSSNGQLISNGNVDGKQFIVDLNGLSAGIYIVNASFAEGSITKKVIVH
jgi:hypothetical protein